MPHDPKNPPSTSAQAAPLLHAPLSLEGDPSLSSLSSAPASDSPDPRAFANALREQGRLQERLTQTEARLRSLQTHVDATEERLQSQTRKLRLSAGLIVLLLLFGLSGYWQGYLASISQNPFLSPQGSAARTSSEGDPLPPAPSSSSVSPQPPQPTPSSLLSPHTPPSTPPPPLSSEGPAPSDTRREAPQPPHPRLKRTTKGQANSSSSQPSPYRASKLASKTRPSSPSITALSPGSSGSLRSLRSPGSPGSLGSPDSLSPLGSKGMTAAIYRPSIPGQCQEGYAWLCRSVCFQWSATGRCLRPNPQPLCRCLRIPAPVLAAWEVKDAPAMADIDRLRKLVAAFQTGPRLCYRLAAQGEAKPPFGSLQITVTLGLDGRLILPTVTKNPIPLPALAPCLVRHVARWKLPPGIASGPVELVLHFKPLWTPPLP